MSDTNEKIAVIIPCYNEAITIAKVIDDFKRELPTADIYVYDNNSSDDTAKIAKEHGAIVRTETRQGKGRVVRQMTRDITADYYVMVDGDDTYPAEAVHDLLKPLRNNMADMTIGDRLSNGSYGDENDRAFHGLGNNLVRWLIKMIYKFNFNDVMTGYRAYNTVFAKALPILSPGFQIETELSIHAVDKSWRIVEVPIDYRDRPEGSESKLSTFGDGMKVIMMIMSLFKEYRPLMLFGIIAIVCFILGLACGIPVIIDYVNTGLVERFPTAILALGFMLFALLNLITGWILSSVVKGQRMQYEIEVNRIYDMYGKTK